jgi:hypothetical protein
LATSGGSGTRGGSHLVILYLVPIRSAAKALRQQRKNPPIWCDERDAKRRL